MVVSSGQGGMEEKERAREMALCHANRWGCKAVVHVQGRSSCSDRDVKCHGQVINMPLLKGSDVGFKCW